MSRLRVDVDGTDLDSAVLGRGYPRGPVERVIEGRAVEDEETPERLLDLGVRPVGDEPLVVADTDGRGARGRGELLAADEDARGPRSLGELAVLLVCGVALGVGHRLPHALVGVDQSQVLHGCFLSVGAAGLGWRTIGHGRNRHRHRGERAPAWSRTVTLLIAGPRPVQRPLWGNAAPLPERSQQTGAV